MQTACIGPCFREPILLNIFHLAPSHSPILGLLLAAYGTSRRKTEQPIRNLLLDFKHGRHGPPSLALVDILFPPAAGDSLALERATATGAREFHLLPLALAGGWAKAATCAPALPRSFPLLRGHLLPTLGHAVRHALFHATADTGATGTVPAKSADEDPAKQQESQRLPEGDLAPTEERRQQPVPQVQHYFAADGDKEQHPQNRQRTDENQSLQSWSHVQSLTLS